MKSIFTFVAVLFTSFGLMVGGMEVAEAKRLGSGTSFGSKFSQSQSIKKSPVQRNQAASPAQTQNAAAKQKLASKGGLMGLLGGLAIGGLLGALFFGGAFEGFNFFDFAMIALVAFVAFKLLGAMARRNQPATAGGPQMDDYNQYRDNSQGDYGSSAASGNDIDEGQSLDDLRGAAPKGFDQEAFLEGAKNCFARLQRAWDDGDLADIRQFTTDHVFGEIQEQLHNRIGQNETQILDLQAELLKVNELGSKSEATVLFNAKLSENGNEVEIGEVWHFTRPSNSLQPTWLLEGIQQVEQ